jgi:hypothetical protein
MIRSFLFSVLCFVICSSQAQVRVALQAGYNSAKWQYTTTPGNWETSTSAVSSFNVGVLGQLDLTNHIGLQGALLLNGGGTKLKFRYRWDMSSLVMKVYSLNLPVVAMYNIDVKKMRLGFGGGFYGAYMLSGTQKGTAERVIINAPTQITPIDNKIEFGSSDQLFYPGSTDPITLNRFDAGYVVMTSIKFNRLLLFQASYNGGFPEILPGGYAFSGNFKNKVISLSLAVLLSREGS